jgi:ribonucleoside-diphosphate reductase alpha chain
MFSAFEVEPRWIVDAASRRQKWIDQAQSLNLYIAGANGKKLDITYKMAWLRGLKTTYYLRALGATSAEKSTINTGALNAVKPATVAAAVAAPVVAEKKAEVVAEEEGFSQAAPVPSVFNRQSRLRSLSIITSPNPSSKEGITPSYFGVKVPLLQRDLGKLGI